MFRVGTNPIREVLDCRVPNQETLLSELAKKKNELSERIKNLKTEMKNPGRSPDKKKSDEDLHSELKRSIPLIESYLGDMQQAVLVQDELQFLASFSKSMKPEEIERDAKTSPNSSFLFSSRLLKESRAWKIVEREHLKLSLAEDLTDDFLAKATKDSKNEPPGSGLKRFIIIIRNRYKDCFDRQIFEVSDLQDWRDKILSNRVEIHNNWDLQNWNDQVKNTRHGMKKKVHSR